MAAEPGAPLMGFVCVIDGVTHLHGKSTKNRLTKYSYDKPPASVAQLVECPLRDW